VKRLAWLLLLSACWGPPSRALEILHWERLPLSVRLVVDQERVIFVDRKVRIGIPASLGGHLRVQSADGAVYLRASAPLPATRLQLQDIDTGALILLDITAEAAKPEQAPLEPIRIVEGQTPTSESAHASNTSELDRSTIQSTVIGPPTPVPVVLTRYAAQSLYAPLRTVEAVKAISRAPLPHDLAMDTFLPSLPVRASALVAWRLDDYWVTAIRLTNTAGHRLDLDPRALQGDFLAATFQHSNLGPAGESTDTTVLYLVTRGHGLGESLLPAISPADATIHLPAPDPVDAGHDHEK